MVSLYYSEQAKSDLIDIGLYIAGNNPGAAQRLIVKICDACESLKDFPLSGQSRNDVRPDVRHRVVDNYLILYRVDNDTIDIGRIIHSSRYLPDII